MEARKPAPSPLKKGAVARPAGSPKTPPSPRSPGAPAILVTVVRCVEKRDAANTFILYPGASLYYVFAVKTGGGSWEVSRRFSEVKKFWEKLRPQAAAAGAVLDEFPHHSALLTGQGALGNYLETSPRSPFASRRVDLLRDLATQLATTKNATGGSLFELRSVRAFFDIDEAALRASSSSTLAPAAGGGGGDAVSDAAAAPKTTVADEIAARDAADAKLAALREATRPKDAATALSRSTPVAFCTVFVVVLTALFLFEA